ncbi:MAG: FecR domain-containing protein [Chitinophagaceae bacterium]
MEIPDTIYTLIARKLDGEASEEEVLTLESWLREAKGNQDTLRELEGIYEATGRYLQQPVDVDRAWSKLEGKIESSASVIPMHNPNRFRRIFSVAATFLIVIVAAWFARSFFFDSSWEKAVASTTNLEKILPDGSRVWIRKGGTLEWKTDFKTDREVKLAGEAYFDVQQDAKNKFTVTTGQSVTTVMGTAFTIRSQGGFDQVIVSRGKVNVTSVIENKPASLLLPGDKLVISKYKMTRSSVSDSNFLSWKTGQLRFKEMNLEKVLKALSDFYQVPISAKTEALSENALVTVSFDNETLPKALEEISMITGLTVIKQSDGTFVYSKK